MCTVNLRTKNYERKENTVLCKKERFSFPHVSRLHSQTFVNKWINFSTPLAALQEKV